MSGDHVSVSSAGKHKGRLLISFCLTLTFLVIEVIGGIITGSLALLSDAAHMGTDVLGLGMALAAVQLASRQAPPQRTYGTYRLEVLAALANSVLLFAVAGYVLFESFKRFFEPAEVKGLPMLVVAVAGLVVNLISFQLLRSGSKESLNVKGAYFEVLSDLLGSIGVIVAAGVIALTGWTYIDPLIGAAIGLFILPRTYKLASQAIRILMEAAPEGIDVDEVRSSIVALPGVTSLHDFHLWTVTSGIDAASGHVVVDANADADAVLAAVTTHLADRYQVTHATIQCEPPDYSHAPNEI